MRLDGTSTEQRCDPGDAGGSWRGHSKKGRGEVIARKNVPSSPCRRTTRNRIIFYEGIVSALHIGSLTTRASSSPSSLPITAYPRIPTSLPRAPLRSLAPCISRGDAERHCVHSREGNGKELAFFLFLSSDSSAFYYWPHYPRGHEPCAFHPCHASTAPLSPGFPPRSGVLYG